VKRFDYKCCSECLMDTEYLMSLMQDTTTARHTETTICVNQVLYDIF
jgi:hypothetical protein